MISHIIITPEQANAIRGNYGRYSAIDPIATGGGNFIIPDKCLLDPDLVDAKDSIELVSGVIKTNSEDGDVCYLSTNSEDGSIELICINKL